MRRLIRSRGPWLALLAALAAVAIVVFVRSRRHPTDPRPAPPNETAPETPAPAAPWPPVPILGTPTAEDLARFAARPSVLDRPAFAGFFAPGEPGEPLEEAARRRLTRWGMAGLALVLLAAGTHMMESAVFSKETETAIQQPFLGHMEDIHGVPSGDPLPQPAISAESPSDEDCLPRNVDPTVRERDAKVTRAVNRQWRRIETWLRTNAPRSHRTLGKAGDAETIAAAEAFMGMRFPDDLRASLLRHDGPVLSERTGAFGFLGHENLSVQRIRDTWTSLCEVEGEDRDDAGIFYPRMDWWDGRMIPFAADGTGNHLVIDSLMRDVGQTDHQDVMSFTPGGVPIRSYYALLKATADALENDRAIGYWKPRAVAGELEWEIVDS